MTLNLVRFGPSLFNEMHAINSFIALSQLFKFVTLADSSFLHFQISILRKLESATFNRLESFEFHSATPILVCS